MSPISEPARRIHPLTQECRDDFVRRYGPRGVCGGVWRRLSSDIAQEQADASVYPRLVSIFRKEEFSEALRWSPPRLIMRRQPRPRATDSRRTTAATRP